MAKTVKSKQNFEVMLTDLEQIVQEMERGDLPLDELLSKFATGVELVKQCRSQLVKAEELIQQQLPL